MAFEGAKSFLLSLPLYHRHILKTKSEHVRTLEWNLDVRLLFWPIWLIWLKSLQHGHRYIVFSFVISFRFWPTWACGKFGADLNRAGPTSLWKKYEVMISYAEQEHFALVSRQSCDTKAKTLRPQPEWQVRCIRSSVNPLMLCNRAAKRYAGLTWGLTRLFLTPTLLFWLQKDQLCFGAAFLHDGLMDGWIDG